MEGRAVIDNDTIAIAKTTMLEIINLAVYTVLQSDGGAVESSVQPWVVPCRLRRVSVWHGFEPGFCCSEGQMGEVFSGRSGYSKPLTSAFWEREKAKRHWTIGVCVHFPWVRRAC